MTMDKTSVGYVRVLRDTHRAICYERCDNPNKVQTAYSAGADAIENIRKDLTLQWRPISEYDPDTMFGCVFYGRADGEARIWTHTIRKPTHFMQLTPPESNHDTH